MRKRKPSLASIIASIAVAVALFAMSPAFQGYHVGYSSIDTSCVTRLVVQFCKNEHARIARAIAHREAAIAAQECRAVAKEAEEGKRTLNAGNYYLRCLRSGVNQQALLRKWEAQERKESEQQTGAVGARESASGSRSGLAETAGESAHGRR